MKNDFEVEQDYMVQNHLRTRGITDELVLGAFKKVQRHEFVRDGDLGEAYADHPLPIGEGQTISQPYIVALMTQALGLDGSGRILEIGTGSGYQTAIISLLAEQVFSVERMETLLVSARERLERLGCRNVAFKLGDGTLGWEENAPFDGIIVTAAAPAMPPALITQLGEGGRMVIPVGSGPSQALISIRKLGGELKQTHLCGCVFVKLIGEQGWKE